MCKSPEPAAAGPRATMGGRCPSSASPAPTRRPAISRRPSKPSPRSVRRGGAVPDAPRRHGHREDRHDGLDDRADPAADAHHRAQQDARRAALQRVPRVSAGQRGRVLRLLLRLLPARGLRPAGRPLHREGRVGERRHRPAAPRGLERAPRRAATSSSSPRCRASTASAPRRSTRTRPCSSPSGTRSTGTSSCASSSTSSTRETTRFSAVAASACGATSSRCSPPRWSPHTASRCSGTRSSRSRTSIRSRERSSPASSISPIFPATQYVTDKGTIERSVGEIRHELEEQVKLFETEGKLLEAHRIRQRTEYDIEMLQELGYCNGIENYSRILDGRSAGTRPAHASRLLPRRLRRLRGRVAPDRAADRRHVRRRPLAEADARRLRLPAPVGARQPAAPLRRVPGASRRSSSSSPRRPDRSSAVGRPRSRSRSSGRPGSSTPTSSSGRRRTRSTTS